MDSSCIPKIDIISFSLHPAIAISIKTIINQFYSHNDIHFINQNKHNQPIKQYMYIHTYIYSQLEFNE